MRSRGRLSGSGRRAGLIPVRSRFSLCFSGAAISALAYSSARASSRSAMASSSCSMSCLPRLPELLPPGLREHQFQPLDLKRPNFRLAARFRQHLALGEDHHMSGGKVCRERIGRRYHDPIQPYSQTKIAPDLPISSNNHSFILPLARARFSVACANQFLREGKPSERC